MPHTEDSKKKKAEESIQKPPAKRHKNDEILHTIPWSAVFQFLGGEDVAKALMSSKHNTPWKLELVKEGKGNEEQCILSALKDRLVATQYGKELLEKYYDNTNPQFLPKLLYCMDQLDHGCGLRYDGIYQYRHVEPPFSIFLRFYPTGEVFGTLTTREFGLDSMWRWLDKENEETLNGIVAVFKGTYQCDFLPTGQNTFLVRPSCRLISSWQPGPIGPNGELAFFTRSIATPSQKLSRKCRFVVKP